MKKKYIIICTIVLLTIVLIILAIRINGNPNKKINSNLYKIDEEYKNLPTVTNNYFKYYKFNIDRTIPYVGAYSIKNITKEEKIAAIYVKFYDKDKNYLTEYNTRKLSFFELKLKPNEEKSLTFTMYKDDTGIFDINKLSEAYYYSIEDIEE